jgi:hypothetical protein
VSRRLSTRPPEVDADEVLCHCRVNPDGHEPGSVLDCEAPVIRPGSYSRTQVGGVGYSRPTGARGTCPDCGRTGVTVKRHEVRTTDAPDVHDLVPGALVAIRPALAAHKTPGRGSKPCLTGEGKVPAETRYRSTALDAMVRDFGSAAVA